MKPYLKKKTGRPLNRPVENGGAAAANKRMNEWKRVAGQAVLMLRRAVDQWDDDHRVLHQVPAVLKDSWMREFIAEAKKLIGEPTSFRGPHETPDI